MGKSIYYVKANQPFFMLNWIILQRIKSRKNYRSHFSQVCHERWCKHESVLKIILADVETLNLNFREGAFKKLNKTCIPHGKAQR